MADLLEVATVNPDDGREWRLGYDQTARECNVQVEFAEACDTNYIALVGDENSFGPGQYKVVPFILEAFLRQGILCQEPDDGAWFRASFEGIAEYAFTRALVIQAVPGTESWIGDNSVQVQTLAGSTDANLETGITAARALWLSTVVTPDGKPIMHVPPSMVYRLVRLGMLLATTEGKVYSPMGDKVVVGDGYDANPHVFFTGPIVIRTGPVKVEEDLIHARMNDTTIAGDHLGMIDVAPCSIVVVGA
jgi:hypothetical protein